MAFHTRRHTSSFLFAALLPGAALAQVPPTPSAQPARIQEQLRIEDTRPAVGGAPLITLPDEAGRDTPLKAGARFTLRELEVQNASVFSAAELRAEYAQTLGQKVTLADLQGIAARITARYRNAGYILSRAVVPPQRIRNGRARIAVVEGFADRVILEGDAAASPLLQAYAEKIRAARPLSTATLERYLLLIQDLPGVTARALLRPSPMVKGASDVIITVTQKSYDGAVSADNRGTRYIGPYQGGVTANFNHVLGIHDRTQLRGILTADPSELQFFQVSHDEQIGTEGTRLTLAAAHTRTQPNFRLKAFDIEGTDTLVSAQLLHPFLRSRQDNLWGNASFDIRNTHSASFDVPLYADRLKVGRIGGAYDFVDRWTAVNRFDAQLSKGFGWDDNSGTQARSRFNGRTDFWKLTATANRLQTLSGPFSYSLSGTAQAASAALLSAEQFGLGGPTFLSAYDPSEVTGDSGIAGRAELHYSQTPHYRFLAAYQLYVFYDIGTAWTRNPAAGIEEQTSLASAGAGMRFNLLAPLSGSLEVAQPLTKDVNANRPNNGDDTRVFFSLAYRY